MKIAKIQDFSTVDGAGQRLVIFMTGCSHACPGCQNEKLWNYNYGVEWSIEDIIDYIKKRLHWIDGITLSGGDPLYQLNETARLLKAIRDDPELHNLNIWLYTGYLFEDIPNGIKIKVDYIKDGKYDKNLPPAAYRGSNNQRIFKRIVGNKFERAYENEWDL